MPGSFSGAKGLLLGTPLWGIVTESPSPCLGLVMVFFSCPQHAVVPVKGRFQGGLAPEQGEK